MASLLFLTLFALALRCTATLGIPASDATVDVKAFNVANITTTLPGVLIQPVVSEHNTISLPLHAFLIEHTTSKKRFMFDLGMRTDPLNLAPSVSSFFQSGVYSVNAPFKGITELLEEGGIPLESIETVIWSHSHFDHISDMSLWPNTTNLVIGPGTNRSLYPEFPDSALQASDFAGHDVIELNFNNTNITFGGLPAIDYFGDGSFYLLNTPGHLIGHITGLARVTPSTYNQSSTFIVLGADTSHHPGQLRPRPKFQATYPCPAHLLTQSRTSVSTDYFWSPGSDVGVFDVLSREQPLLSIPDLPNSGDADPVTNRVSLDKIADFDANNDFFVILAHDESLIDVLPYFPASLSTWKEDGIKDKVLWGFLDEKNPAFRFGPSA
ncbi:Metallo-beta-lactamase superfamily protein [Mycena sanguinolenta]|uniref:Metallo-beta-lactamase superfamily protein n=1 Tax=Mycena sanguinolenta TaxID=230812 RepID=A0A8H6YJ58_9AGAR|nr:Metallo-beta-lactamase superfamily protein [Mycena sanguinolenta]